MKIASTLAAAALLASGEVALASDLEGPGRFCGYSPIIDLFRGERITTLQGGIHGGMFEWTGNFGTFEVHGIGWASRPRGWMVTEPTRKGHALFEQRREGGRYVVAIWNHANGAAYFYSKRPFTDKQMAAIDRVDLFDENQDEPEGCNLRTVFAWD